eukprot:m.160594 g.160594  ORF g.160594 m.160594 type:complete len:125 (+) comp16505_c0_seq6:2328-2702(+)
MGGLMVLRAFEYVHRWRCSSSMIPSGSCIGCCLEQSELRQQGGWVFQRLGYALAGHTSNVQLGYVDCDRQQRRCQQLNIPHYPYLLYFAPGSSNPTAMDTQDLDGLMRTVAELANTPQPSHDEL